MQNNNSSADYISLFSQIIKLMIHDFVFVPELNYKHY